MTNRPGPWTRRQFSQALAASAASTLLVRNASARPGAGHHGFAFAGISATDPRGGAVRVYRVTGGTWREAHSVDAASPAHLVMHPALPVLYVVHNVAEWDHRPRGAVSAYRLDTVTGHLSRLGTQPLSLSATNPRHAVVTADGQALFVAAESGGMYNLLPIAADGSLHSVSAIRKECGLQEAGREKTAAPRQLVLHADGSVYAADPGQETLSRFEVRRDTITLQHRSQVHAGAGASQIAVSPCGTRVYALHATDGFLAMQSLTAEDAPQTCAGIQGVSMQMHPGGALLAVSSHDALQVLRVHSGGTRLTLQERVPQARLRQLSFAAGGTLLAGIQAASGEIMSRSFDPRTGAFGPPNVVTRVDGASSLLLHLA